MRQDEDLDRLIGLLYEAALEPQLWCDAFMDMLKIVDAQVGHLFLTHRSERTIISSILWGPGYDKEIMGEVDAKYMSYYGAIDPRRVLTEKLGVGEWVVCHRQINDDFVRRSEFYNDFLIPTAGMRYLIGARLCDMEEHSVFIGISRAVGQRPFGDGEVRRIKRVQTHLARAARLSFKSQALQMQLDSGLRTLDALDFPVLIVDQSGMVRFANSAAEDLLRQPGGTLAMRRGRLVHAVSHGQTQLEALIRGAVTGARGGGMWLTTGGDHPGGYLLVVPLSPRSRLGAPWQIPLALVFVSNPIDRGALPAHLLRTLFDLTPAEVRLAEALVQGESPGEYSARAGISLNTVRTQLRSVFEKTQTHRQAELVKLLTSFPTRNLNE